MLTALCRASIARFLIVAAGPLVLSGCMNAGQRPEEAYIAGYTPEELRDLTTAEKALLAKGFAKNLKDPDSAKFEWTKIPRDWSKNGGGFDYCATLNAKNSYGGYIGQQPFIAFVMTSNSNITGGYITGIAGADPLEGRLVTEMCAKKGLDPSPRPPYTPGR